ncbi:MULTISPECIES: ATP-binding protein [Nitrospirillum]|uniref:histidine kinase n=1 Tax=Nitrospirillum amazonense TaxID=28077 RepID=A0A560GD25_9PROT|nr:ATP-binding protein [Nitrospirillum amazonense]MEC4591919.1 ATP-binding protein [Nitrospirillum amazonense]TWB31818.1 phospho-acceptor domain-containing protein [Nitrospirillum amazonense]
MADGEDVAAGGRGIAAAMPAPAGLRAAAPRRSAQTSSPALGVRGRLLLAAVTLLLPPLLGGALLLGGAYTRERRVAERHLDETAHMLALAVDQQLGQSQAYLRALIASPALAHGDIAALEAQARAIDLPKGYWFRLAAASDGRVLMNTALPPGTPLSGGQLGPNLRAALEARHSRVGNLFNSTLTNQQAIALHEPVFQNGAPAYILSLVMPSTEFTQLLTDQQLRAGWIGAVVDRSGVIIARTRDPERYVGQKARPEFVEAYAKQTSGRMPGVSLEGMPTMVSFRRTPSQDLVVAIAAPRDELGREAWRGLLLALAGAVALLGLAMGLALRLARGITYPVEQLAARAAALGRGAPVPTETLGLAEADAVAQVLADASQRLARSSAEQEEKVRAAVAEAESANTALFQAHRMEAVGRLTGGIAHDFNNLLQAVSGCLDMLLRRAPDDRSRDLIRAGMQAVDRGAGLTRQLMAFARRQALRPEPVDVAELVRTMRQLLMHALRADIVLEMVLPQGLWPAMADSAQLELALLNVAVNARDAMPNGGVLRFVAENVHLAPDQTEDALKGQFVRLAITDTGSGIDPAVLPHVFEPFFTTKEVGKGSGLGLSQVYGFARQSGGTVHLDSVPGVGTTVTLFLPRAATAPRRPPAPAEARPADRVETRIVLVVEDDATVSATVSASLKERGFTVLQASRADQALALLQDGDTIDILFSDIVMPGGMNGVELAKVARLLRPDLAVLLTTGYAENLPPLEGMRLLPKPYRMDQLLDALDALD